MDDLEKYRHWLISARGIENPSDEEVKRFREKARRHRPYGSILGLLKMLRMDARGDYGGTRAYLLFQGFSDPSADDLIYFHGRIRRALLWRVSVGVLVFAGGLVYFWCAHLPPFR